MAHRSRRFLTAIGSLLLLPSVATAQTAPAPAPPAPSSPVAETPATTAPAPVDSPTPAPSEPVAPSEPEAPAPPTAPAPTEPPSAEAAPAAPTEPKSKAAEPVPSAPPAVALTPEPVPSAPGSEAEEDNEVVVLGSSLSQAAGSVQVLTEKQLERFNYDDPSQALKQVPGVFIREEDGIGLRPNIGMRGVNPNRSAKLTLMEDGVLFGPAPYSAPAGYFFPLFTRMTQIRVIKGPSAIAYGPQTTAGAIDFISRPIPIDTAGGADVALGDFGYSKAHVHFGTSTEHFGFLVEGIRLQNTGFAQLPSGADTGSTRNEWMVKTSYVVDPQAKVRNEFLLKLLYTDEKSNETYVGQSDADFRVNPYNRHAASALDQMNNHRTAIALTHVLDIKPQHIVLKTTAYRNDLHRIWKKLNRLGGAAVSSVLDNPTEPSNVGYYNVIRGEQDSGSPAELLFIGPNDRTFVSQGIQSNLTASANTGPLGHKFEAGLRLHNDQIRRIHTEDAYNMINGLPVYAGQGTLTWADNLATTYAAAIHATDAITFKKLTVTPGIRTELIQSNSSDYLTGADASRFLTAVMPGAGAFLEILPGFGALAGVYRGFSPPAPGSPGFVSPEYSVNYEAGARFVKGLAHAEAIGFYNDYSNLTNICTLSSGCVTGGLDRQFDAGAARIYGLEALVGHEVPLPASFKIPFTVSYTYTRGEFLSSFQSGDPIYGSVAAGDSVPYIPENQANLTLGVEHRYGGINGTLNYVGRMREIAGTGAYDEAWTTDEQTWLDLSAFAKPLPWLTIYANLRNVTGEAYIGGRRPYGARANAPRWFQLGAKAEF